VPIIYRIRHVTGATAPNIHLQKTVGRCVYPVKVITWQSGLDKNELSITISL
jgi:hypothetical protein